MAQPINVKEKRLLIIVAAAFLFAWLAPSYSEQYAYQYVASEQSQQSELRADIQNFRQRLDSIEDERLLLQASREGYLKWADRAVVEDADRIQWVEVMQSISKDRRFFPPIYDIKDRVSHSPGDFPLTADSTASVVFIPVEIAMPMLHDMDMLMFLADLDAKIDDLFFPVECSFVRENEDFALVLRENFRAHCDISWVAIDDPERVIEATTN